MAVKSNPPKIMWITIKNRRIPPPFLNCKTVKRDIDNNLRCILFNGQLNIEYDELY